MGFGFYDAGKALAKYLGVKVMHDDEDNGFWIYGPGGRAWMSREEANDLMRGSESSLVERIHHLKPRRAPKFRFRIGRRLRK